MRKEFEINQEFASMSDDTRISALDAACDAKNENYTYYRALKAAELREKSERINQLWIELNKLNEEKKQLTALCKPLNAESNLLHSEIASKSLSFTETIWQVNNLENGMTELINKDGLVIDSWRFREGTQMNVFRNAVNE